MQTLFNGVIPVPERRDQANNPAVPLSVALAGAFDGMSGPTAAGERISEGSALQQITVYACIKVLSESIGSLTLRTYTRTDKGRTEALDNPIHRMLSLSPNNEMTACTLWESIVGCMALTGNSYCQIVRDGLGNAAQLYPLHPLKTEPTRLPDGSLAYRTSDGMGTGSTRILPSKDVLHFPLFSWVGLKGLSPIAQARQTLGLAVATDKFSARFFGNNSQPPAILSPKSQFSDLQMSNIRQSWESANGGENQRRVAILPGEWSYQQIGLSPEDSQFLQTKAHTRSDIAALFRVPAHMVGDQSKLSNSNWEQQSLSFVVDTLRPYMVRIEQELSRKIFTDPSVFAEFDVSDRLRGDFPSRMAGYATGRQWGLFTANECREAEGLNPAGEEADILWAPVNMMDSAKLLAAPASALDGPVDVGAAPLESKSFMPVFSDAIRRYNSRSIAPENLESSVTQLFEPLIDSLIVLSVTRARSELHVGADWEPSNKAKTEAIRAISSRFSRLLGLRESITDPCVEFNKLYRSIIVPIYRDAAAHLANEGIVQNA